MRRLRLVLEYDGTGFSGFQRLPEHVTVQETLEGHLSEVCREPVQVTGAGRTDAGVHAFGQVAHFDIAGRIPAEGLERAVNDRCGPALALRQVEETSAEFHARFCALRRTYHYYVSRERPAPFLARYVVYEPGLREDAVERMRTALLPLVGRHDFRLLSAGEEPETAAERTLYRAGVEELGPLLRLELTADSFLRSMVRVTAGVLLRIGRGECPPETLGKALGPQGVRPAAQTAPPHGLFLMRVEYPDGYPGPERAALPWDRRLLGNENRERFDA